MKEVSIAIMDAAEKRMRSCGFNGFSFRDIAEDVGIKSSSVHYHFPTKEKLAAAVVHRYTDRLAEKLDAQLAGGANPHHVLSGVFRATVHSANRMCPVAVLGAGALDLPGEVGVEVQRFFRMLLDKLKDQGLAPDEATELLATCTGAMVVSAALDDFSAFDRATNEYLRTHTAQ
jgi:TetR/AcrR family transcriptional repressor of nem operon